MNKANLYAVLGLTSTATAEEIKTAYKRQAQKTHPDKPGGDSTDFLEVSTAYDVLIDPKRRAHYDETGEINMFSPNRDLAGEQLAALFNAQIMNGNFSGNIVSSCEQKVNQARNLLQRQLADLIEKRDKLKSATGRVSSEYDHNLFENILDSQISSLDKQIENSKNELTVLDDVLGLLAKYSGTSPEEKPEFAGLGGGVQGAMGGFWGSPRT